MATAAATLVPGAPHTNVSAVGSAGNSGNVKAPQTPKTFDFTRRRRWADVLLSALPGAALFVIDKHGSIEYSGPGTRAVLGWDVDDVIERNVLEFVNGESYLFHLFNLITSLIYFRPVIAYADGCGYVEDDRDAFSARLRRALVSREDLACFTRLKRKPRPALNSAGLSTTNTGSSSGPVTAAPDVLLFDVRGHALYLDFELDDIDGSSAKHSRRQGAPIANDNDVSGTVLFFLMAKPYPSRNVAMCVYLEYQFTNRTNFHDKFFFKLIFIHKKVKHLPRT